MVKTDFKRVARDYGAKIAGELFGNLFAMRLKDDSIKIPKALELAFEHPSTPDEEKIKELIVAYRALKVPELEQELFKQKKRLGEAERTLKTKATKKAENDQRIATDKIEKLTKRIGSVMRTEPKAGDGRIFPFQYAPIIVDEGKGLQIIPARYHCRPAGKPLLFDRQLPGLYNARRDSLEKFWREIFTQHHALMLVESFYENVSLHRFEKRELKPGEEEQNIVLHFNPQPANEMRVACLWSRWSKDLITFAAITDNPPPEISEAGHDRVIIALTDENVESWLKTGGTREAYYKLFDEHDAPHYEHQRIAA